MISPLLKVMTSWHIFSRVWIIFREIDMAHKETLKQGSSWLLLGTSSWVVYMNEIRRSRPLCKIGSDEITIWDFDFVSSGTWSLLLWVNLFIINITKIYACSKKTQTMYPIYHLYMVSRDCYTSVPSHTISEHALRRYHLIH